MSDRHRYARQLLLAEIGPVGQARIAASHFQEEDNPASAVAAEYLRRAGAKSDADGSTVIPLLAPEGGPKYRIALDTLAGSLGALEALRRALGMTPAEPLRPPL